MREAEQKEPEQRGPEASQASAAIAQESAKAGGAEEPGKRELQKEARRHAVVEAGFHEFVSRGFSAARLDDVAERAGISKGAIYLYFENKEELFAEVVRRNLGPVQAESASLIDSFQGSASELLALHFRNIYASLHGARVPQLIGLVLGETARFPRLTEFLFREVVSRNRELLRGIIQKGIESGEFRPDSPLEHVQIVMAPALLSAIWKIQFDRYSPLDMEEYAQAHVEFALRGLKA